MANKEIDAQNTHGLTYISTTEHAGVCVLLLPAVPPMQSSPMILHSSVTTFCRGSREIRSSSNQMLLAAGGRGNEPSKSDTRKHHPTLMLMQVMIEAAARQHRIHDGIGRFCLGKVGECLR